MKFRNRNFVSILTAFSFLAVALTGILYFIGLKNYYVEAIHVFGGFLFVVTSIFHIVFNFKALKSYIISKRKVINNIKFIEVSTAFVVCLTLFLFIFFCETTTDNIIHSGRKIFGIEKKHDHTKHENKIDMESL